MFIYGYIVLAVQPIAPLNPRGLGMLAPTTIFNGDVVYDEHQLQHYSGDVHFSNFTQVFFSSRINSFRRRLGSAH